MRVSLPPLLSRFLLGATLTASLVSAQAKPEAVHAPDAAPRVYRLDFIVHQLQDGKPLTTRKYHLLLRDDGFAKIRVGSRIPFLTAPVGGQYQYQNVGLNLDCRAEKKLSDDTQVALQVTLEINTVAEQQPGNSSLPVVRNANSQIDTIIPLGKLISVDRFDDLASNQSYDLEILAVKVGG